MSGHTIVGVIALVCVAICGITSSFVMLQIVDRVNERLPDKQQFAHLGYNPI
jgi:hypothetical protein